MGFFAWLLGRNNNVLEIEVELEEVEHQHKVVLEKVKLQRQSITDTMQQITRVKEEALALLENGGFHGSE